MDGDYVIEVYGQQWWWEVHYPYMGAPERSGVNTSLVTANEIRVPIGKNIQIKLFSNNVIHSFYVPQLSGKMDVCPGISTKSLSFTVRTMSERYFGECAEFCGDSHAWMRFQVIVAPNRRQFDSWVAAYNAGAHRQRAQLWNDDPGTASPQPSRICRLLHACHSVNGTNGHVRAEWSR